MSSIDRLSERGSSLVTQARDSLASGAAHLPKWLEAGAALGIAKTGARAATTLARRNPGVAIALGVVGVGVLAYRFYRRRAEASATHAPAALVVHRRSERQEDVQGAERDEAPKARKRKGVKSDAKPRATARSRSE